MENNFDNELGIFELFKKSFRIYKNNILHMIFICILVYLPMYICIYVMPESMKLSIESIFKNETNNLSILINLLPTILFNPLGVAALSSIANLSMKGERVHISNILDDSLIKWGKLVAATLIYYLTILFFSFLVIPSVYFAVAFYFYATVIVLNDCPSMMSLIISRVNTLRRWFKAAGLLILSKILSICIYYATLKLYLFFTDADNIFIDILFSLLNELLSMAFYIIPIVWFINVAKVNESNFKKIFNNRY